MQTVKRVRVISLCLVVVLLGLGLLAGAATAKAQENNAAPPSPQKAAEPAAPPSATPEKPVDSAREFAKVLDYVYKRGSMTLMEGYICQSLGLTRDYNQGTVSQLSSRAYVSDLDRTRVAYLLDTREIILTSKNGDNLTIYVVDKKGHLEKAAMTHKSRAITMIRLPLAYSGFEVEKRFWIKEANFNSDFKSED
jgi:hypothetical protein